MGPLPVAPIHLSPELSRWLLTVLAPGIVLEAGIWFLVDPTEEGKLLTANLNGAGVVTAIALIFALALVLGSVNRTLGFAFCAKAGGRKDANSTTPPSRMSDTGQPTAGNSPPEVVWASLKKDFSEGALVSALDGLPCFAPKGDERETPLLPGYYRFARTYLRRIGDYSSEWLETEINLWAALILPLPIAGIVVLCEAARSDNPISAGFVLSRVLGVTLILLGWHFRNKVSKKRAGEHELAMRSCFLGRALEVQEDRPSSAELPE